MSEPCNPNDVFNLLLAAFGPRRWWPAEGPEEMIIGALLTQNTSWKNVERALDNLRRRQRLSLAAIAAAPLSELQEDLRPSGYFRRKSTRLKNLAAAVLAAGGLELLEQKTTPALREWFLNLTGIGPETADSILLYAFTRPLFVIDAYTLRICKRHDWLPETADYREAQDFFSRRLPADPALFNEFHALLVEVGKHFCRPRQPRCRECPLHKLSDHAGQREEDERRIELKKHCH
ncbi:MAG: endonuclease III domain-containing protein [Deltaproteobacteria bacterium]|nr:endonuclease III domain-containing protein [Deltaproteobacteria bacterium]